MTSFEFTVAEEITLTKDISYLFNRADNGDTKIWSRGVPIKTIGDTGAGLTVTTTPALSADVLSKVLETLQQNQGKDTGFLTTAVSAIPGAGPFAALLVDGFTSQFGRITEALSKVTGMLGEAKEDVPSKSAAKLNAAIAELEAANAKLSAG